MNTKTQNIRNITEWGFGEEVNLFPTLTLTGEKGIGHRFYIWSTDNEEIVENRVFGTFASLVEWANNNLIHSWTEDGYKIREI
jgi:hypothetical protein